MLDARLAQLEHAPFFHDELLEYTRCLRRVIKVTLKRPASEQPGEMVRMVVDHLWTATRYLTGSVSRETPYETVYGLDLAIQDWIPASQGPRLIITTALLNERNYHFCAVEDEFYTLAKDLGVTFSSNLVQVGLPHLYKHQPLHNVLLYHELGHFIDEKFKISRVMAIIVENVEGPWSKLTYTARQYAEFFADIFATSYVDSSVAHMLHDMAPDQVQTKSHPATAERVTLIEEMLAHKTPPILQLANAALSYRSLPALTTRFQIPDIKHTFDNLLPYTIASQNEVHGLLPAGRRYLHDVDRQQHGLWAAMTANEKSRVVNDLIEKSIRNRMVQMRWQKCLS